MHSHWPAVVKRPLQIIKKDIPYLSLLMNLLLLSHSKAWVIYLSPSHKLLKACVDSRNCLSMKSDSLGSGHTCMKALKRNCHEHLLMKMMEPWPELRVWLAIRNSCMLSSGSSPFEERMINIYNTALTLSGRQRIIFQKMPRSCSGFLCHNWSFW